MVCTFPQISVDFISLQKVKVKVMYEEFILVPDDNNNDLEFLNWLYW